MMGVVRANRPVVSVHLRAGSQDVGERALLVKFGRSEHIRALRAEGLLYMNPLPYFRRVEGDALRGDRTECADQLARGHRGQISLGNNVLPVEVTSWELQIGPEAPDRMNLFCMYAVRPDHGTFPVDARNADFGDAALVITDPQQFIERIGSLLQAESWQARAGLVEYVANDHRGDFGPLRKKSMFAYQSEWRVVLQGGPGEVVQLSIGSLEDISTLVRSDEVNDFILRNWTAFFGSLKARSTDGISAENSP